MKELYAKIVQTVTYLAKSPREVSRDITTLYGAQVLNNRTVSWQHQALGVPATQPSIFTNIIIVRYHVAVGVNVVNGNQPLVTIPITIATIPYVPTYGKVVKFGTLEDPQSSPEWKMFDDLKSFPPPRPKDLGYPSLHPPTYSAPVGARKIYIGGENNDVHGDLEYVPVYTFCKLYEGSYDWDVEQVMHINDEEEERIEPVHTKEEEKDLKKKENSTYISVLPASAHGHNHVV
jgi:hypothetical protein